MTVPAIDLTRHEAPLMEELLAAVARVARRGFYVLGEELKRFEGAFAKTCTVEHAIGVGCGTDALYFALRCLGVDKDCRVATVANTAVPTVMAIRWCQAVPLFVAIDDETGLMSPCGLDEALTEAKQDGGPPVKAIVPVHLYGGAVEMQALCEVAQRHACPVVEDCCQAHGARCHDQAVGSWGAMGCFSFYPTKNLSCWGNGGMVVTNDDGHAARLRTMRNLGQTTRYDHKVEGYNSQLDEVQAALLQVKLPFLRQWNDERRQLATRYNNSLVGLPRLALPVESEWAHHVYHQYVVRLRETAGAGRDDLRSFLAARGIQTSVHYPKAVHEQEAYRHVYSATDAVLRQSEQWCHSVLSLPLFPGLTDEEVDEVSAALREWP